MRRRLAPVGSSPALSPSPASPSLASPAVLRSPAGSASPSARRPRRRAALRVRLGLAGALAGLVAGAAAAGAVPGLPDPSPVPDVDRLTADPCDPIDPAHCLLPFPNDAFTVEDESTDTGRRVDFSVLAMPRNVAGKPIDPTEWNRNDGFSPGSMVLAVVPGVDLGKTGAAPITDPARSLDGDAPIVLLNTRTGARHPYWAELDANVAPGEQPVLIVRPTVNFDEATRYVVALRGMRDASGAAIAPSEAFRELRDKAPKGGNGNGKGKGHQKNQSRYDRIFAELAGAGVARESLYLAWDFTVASERNLTERILHMRDDAFASLGGAAPTYVVQEVEDRTPAEDAQIARRVTGVVVVPSYLDTPTGAPGSRLSYAGSTDGLPTRLGGVNVQRATFTCIVPRAAFDAPARASLYGHGLLGGQSEVEAGNVKTMAAVHNFTFCATDWQGMATEDVPNVGVILHDMSQFPSLPDRAQQGFLNFMFLARLMKHPQGFAADPAFQTADGRPVFDNAEVFYDGNSQGGIMGGALIAVSQDIRRGVLGVPGMNYSTLLDRSIDFATYEEFMVRAYPSELDREVIFALIQMLWDRGEANGYAHHMTDDPLPGTPPHQVLLHVAFGDHQVANVAAEVEARTIGAATNAAFLAPGRHWAVDPTWGIPTFTGTWDGSALVYWDSGQPTPPNENIPPTAGSDPHGHPRRTAAAQLQKSLFLRADGQVVDTCGGEPCQAR